MNLSIFFISINSSFENPKNSGRFEAVAFLIAPVSFSKLAVNTTTL